MSVSVSVLIDTYNHERYIDAAIRSVLVQEEVNSARIEIVVIDDGSTDRTGEIVQKYGNILRYYRKQNGGQASAFNCGIPLCSGDVICFLDGDDWWHPKKLKMVLEAFRENDAICGVGHSIVEVDEVAGKSIVIGPSALTSINFTSPTAIALFHEFGCCLGTSRLAMRRSAALALLEIPEKLVFEADEYMFTLLPTLGQVIILPEALAYYRIHGENLYQDSRSISLKYKIDPRLLRRASIYECLSRELPAELRKRGCQSSLINIVLGPIHVQASRLRLSTCGGSPLENFKSEYRAAKILKRNNGAFDRIVLLISLGLALTLPPRWYFRVSQMYSNLLRWVRDHLRPVDVA